MLPISTHSALDLVKPASRCRVTGVSDQPKRGLYEALITDALHAQLAEAASAYHVERVELDAAEAPDRYALHLDAAPKVVPTASSHSGLGVQGKG